MFNIYNKQLIREIPLEFNSEFDNVPNASVLLLSKYSTFDESFFERIGNEYWKSLSTELFRSTIVHLLITGKIKAVFFIERTSFCFNLFKINKEGFYLLPVLESSNDSNEQLLEHNILEVLSHMPNPSLKSLKLTIKVVIDSYIGAGISNRPEKHFFLEYIKRYAKKHPWLNLKENTKLFGFIPYFEVHLSEEKQIELQESRKKMNTIQFLLQKENRLFRMFLIDLEKKIEKDFQARYSSD